MNKIITIIGGYYRGRKLYVPNFQFLRPTRHIIKETLFNWLQNDIKGSICVDIFSGSGSLGIEACSRGAKHVTFIDRSKKIYVYLKKISKILDIHNINILCQDALDFLKNNSQNFNIFFLDPPFYNRYYITKCLHILSYKDTICSTGSLLYIESSLDVLYNNNIWKKIASKKSGTVIYGLYEKF